MSPDVAIEINEASKVYEGERRLEALRGVSLVAKSGSFTAILGPSGCGKSTLLSAIAGFETVTEGSIRVFGEAVRGPGPKRAVVFQDASLLPWLTVRENILLSARVSGDNSGAIYDFATRLINRVGLAGFEGHYPAELSGGMRQRVSIGRALLMRPDVLLMDEPFGALDAQTRLQMQELLLDIWEEFRTTVIFITHDIDEAILLADEVHVMSARPGRIQMSMNVELKRPRHADLITEPNFNVIRRQIFDCIRAHV
jgi:NitT/TauT family transport system ATP-binding protein